MRGALQQYQDPDEAINALYGGGRANTAGAPSKHVLESREAKTKAYAADIDARRQAIEFNANVFAGVDDQQKLASARAVAAKTLPVPAWLREELTLHQPHPRFTQDISGPCLAVRADHEGPVPSGRAG